MTRYLINHNCSTNVGPAHPVRWLQRWFNAFNNESRKYADLQIDGSIGDNTLDALRCHLNWRGREGEEVMLRALNCSQGDYYRQITEKRKVNEAFIYGWIKERVVIR